MKAGNAIALAGVLSGLRAVGVSVLMAGLVACGGDGGASSSPASTPTAPVGITSANAASVTGASFRNNQSPADLTANIAQILAAATAGTTDCAAGGSYTLTLTGISSATITLSQCQQVANGPIFDGTVSLTNVIRNGNVTSGTVSLDVTIARTGAPTARIVGSYAFTVTTTGQTTAMELTGSSMTITVGTNNYVFTSFSFSSSLASGVYTNSVNFTLSSTVLGGSVTFTTTTPFLRNAANVYPHAGVAHIVGAGGSNLRVTVLGNETLAGGQQVRIEVDADGDSVYETILTTSWAALVAM